MTGCDGRDATIPLFVLTVRCAAGDDETGPYGASVPRPVGRGRAARMGGAEQVAAHFAALFWQL